MASFVAIRDALKVRLQTIDDGLEVYDVVPGQITTPCAIIGVPEIEYDLAMARGADGWLIPVRIHVQLSDYKQAQDELDAYLDSASGKSVKAAIEGDQTLGGVAATLQVKEVRDYGEYTYGNTTYLGAEWLVWVVTQ